MPGKGFFPAEGELMQRGEGREQAANFDVVVERREGKEPEGEK